MVSAWSDPPDAHLEAIGLDGPIREHYLVTAFDTEDESRHVTEVGWPVFRTASSLR